MVINGIIHRLHTRSIHISLVNPSYTVYQKFTHTSQYVSIRPTYRPISISMTYSIACSFRCDSPGFSAKYCTYSAMCAKTVLTVDFENVQVSQAKNKLSVNMEPIACERLLTRLMEHLDELNALSTDRHASISKLLREKFPSIKHEYDPWHMARNLKKSSIMRLSLLIAKT